MGLLCDLQLDNYSGNYQAGDVISGRIVLTLEERILMKALALKISGYAGVGWIKPIKQKQQKPKNDQITNENNEIIITLDGTKQIVEKYTNREDYISTINYFIGSDAATPKLVESGLYSYAFSALLPEQFPPTFDSAIGHIHCVVEVFIEYPDRRHTCMAHALTVHRPYDLRQDATLKEPYDLDLIEHISFGRFWRRPIELHVNIPQTGFVPGEVISIYVQILNNEPLKLNELVFKLNQIGYYTGVLKKKVCVKTDSRNLQTHVHSLFGQNGTVVQHLQTITIPHGTPATLDATTCKCIQLAYEVEIQVNTTNRKRMLCGTLPIKIGTVSLRSNVQNMPREVNGHVSTLTATRSIEDLSSTADNSLENMQLTNYEPTAPTLEAQNLAASVSSLASFREADFMTSTNLNKSNKHGMSGEKLDFKPKYLYYEIENGQVEGTPMSTSTHSTISADAASEPSAAQLTTSDSKIPL